MKSYPSTHKQSNIRVKPQIQRLKITHLLEKQKQKPNPKHFLQNKKKIEKIE